MYVSVCKNFENLPTRIFENYTTIFVRNKIFFTDAINYNYHSVIKKSAAQHIGGGSSFLIRCPADDAYDSRDDMCSKIKIETRTAQATEGKRENVVEKVFYTSSTGGWIVIIATAREISGNSFNSKFGESQ